MGYLLYKRDITKKYAVFDIKKKSGGTRQIKAPNEQLKFLQQNVAKQLTQLREFKPYVTGFVQNRNLLDNALFHVGKRFVLNIDLEDFFGSINFGRVYGLLCKPPHNVERQIAAAIAKIATHENSLPQGAPTSPILANLICAKLDAEMARLCRVNKCTYSRYADDITISSQMKKFPLAHFEREEDVPSAVILAPELRSLIEANGFAINSSKSRLYKDDWRQEVTGLVVNTKPNVRRTYIRSIRATLNAIEKYGMPLAQKKFEEDYSGKVDLAYRLAGQISFVGQIRGRSDDLYRSLATRFNAAGMSVKLRTALTSKEKAESSVWVLEGESSSGKDPNQGTAFFLEGYGLVTCHHCLAEVMHIYHSQKPTKKYLVSLIKSDADRDLAVLTLPSELSNIPLLKVGKLGQMTNQDKILLMGYPSHYPWKPIRSEAGAFVRSFPVAAIRYFEITPKVISGNSGGPITDENFAVIGVAKRGVTLNTPITEAEYIGIAIDELTALL